MKIEIITIFLILLINQIATQNLCNLKISDNEMASLKGGSDLIYDDGIINESWSENNSFSPHISSLMNDIEYLYATEFHFKEKITSPHEKIKVKIASNDTSISDPKVQVKGEVGEQLDRSTIEVIYNCNASKQGSVKINLTIEPDHCKPFNLVWVKICKEKNHIPKVNIGVTPKSTEIIKEGEMETLPVFSSNSEKLMIRKEYNSFPIYMSISGKENSMQEPQLVYDSNSFQAAITGELSKGGILTSTPQQFTITFACVPFKVTKSDVEVILKFQNNEVISLFFTKECESVGDFQEFDLMYTIYWILLLVIVIFAGIFTFYYFERNEIRLEDLFHKGIEKLKSWISYFSDKWNNRQQGHRSEHHKLGDSDNDNLYEENDLVDIKIKTETKNLDLGKKDKFNNFTTDYGGI